MPPERSRQREVPRCPRIPFPAPALDAETAALIEVAASMASGDTDALDEWLVVAHRVGVPSEWITGLLRQCLVIAGYEKHARARRRCWTVRAVVQKEFGRRGGEEPPSAEEEESFFDAYAAVLAKDENPTRERRRAKLWLRLGHLEALGINPKRVALCRAVQVGIGENVRGFNACLREVRKAGGTRVEIEALLDRLRASVTVERAQWLTAIWDAMCRRHKPKAESTGAPLVSANSSRPPTRASATGSRGARGAPRASPPRSRPPAHRPSGARMGGGSS